MNEPCTECVRGLTHQKKEVCENCSGTGFPHLKVAKAEVKETVVQKVKRAVKKAVK